MHTQFNLDDISDSKCSSLFLTWAKTLNNIIDTNANGESNTFFQVLVLAKDSLGLLLDEIISKTANIDYFCSAKTLFAQS